MPPAENDETIRQVFPHGTGDIDGIAMRGRDSADQHHFWIYIFQDDVDEVILDSIVPNARIENGLVGVQQGSVILTNAVFIHTLAIFFGWGISPLRAQVIIGGCGTDALFAGLDDLVDGVTQGRVQDHRIARKLDLVLVCGHDRGQNGQHRIGTCQPFVFFGAQSGVPFKVSDVLEQFFLPGIQV